MKIIFFKITAVSKGRINCPLRIALVSATLCRSSKRVNLNGIDNIQLCQKTNRWGTIMQ